MLLYTLNKADEIEKKEKICRSRGGESCAFDGAMIVLQPIADAVHLVHGPISCCANSWQGRGTVSEKGSFHKMGFTTDLSELDIILGTENRLFKAIEHIALKVKPSAIFVYSTCVTGLLGEDLEAICLEAKRKFDIDIIPVNAPGFVGPKNLGNRIAGEVLLNYVIGKEEPPDIGERDINLIGEYNIAGDQLFIEPLLQKAGFRILSRITGNSRYREIKWAHRAKLNVVVCSRALVNIGIEMERKYGIPFVEVSFFGKTEIASALRKIVSFFSYDKSFVDKVDNLIEREEKNLEKKLSKYEDLKHKRVVLYTGGVKSWSMISALKDIGLDVVGVGIKKSTYEDEKKIRELVNDDCLIFEDTSPANILKIIEEKKAHILVAGGRNQYLAIKEGFPFVDVNQERHRAYAGYAGLVNLAEDISKALKFYSNKRISKPSVKTKEENSFIDPLKNSPFVGAVMALQGIDKAIPVLYTAQGCNFLGKVLLIKHFREPISMISTNLFTEEVVMGGLEKLVVTIKKLRDKGARLISIITGAISHIKGEQINEETLNLFSNKELKLVHIPLADYEGSLQKGYQQAVERILDLIPQRYTAKKRGQINIIAGHYLTPIDFLEIREIAEMFGLKPIILPDLSSLDGSSSFSGIAKGGVTLEDIEDMVSSEFTIILGESLSSAGKLLKERFGIDYKVFKSLTGIKSNDEFVETLSIISGRGTPERLKRYRKILIDTMRDAHFYLTGKKISVALESDLVFHVSSLLMEMGMSMKLVVLPEKSKSAESIPADEVIIGSLRSIEGKFDLLISNSHAEQNAKRLNAPFYEMGFPVYKTFGYPQKITIGYRGSINIICDMVNLLSRRVHA